MEKRIILKLNYYISNMFGISFFPIHGIAIGLNVKDSNLDGEEGDYIMFQFLFFVFGISLIYVRDTDS